MAGVGSRRRLAVVNVRRMALTSVYVCIPYTRSLGSLGPRRRILGPRTTLDTRSLSDERPLSEPRVPQGLRLLRNTCCMLPHVRVLSGENVSAGSRDQRRGGVARAALLSATRAARSDRGRLLHVWRHPHDGAARGAAPRRAGLRRGRRPLRGAAKAESSDAAAVSAADAADARLAVTLHGQRCASPVLCAHPLRSHMPSMRPQ